MSMYESCMIHGISGWRITEWADDPVVVLQEEYEGRPIISIGRCAFAEHKNLKNLMLPQRLIEIDDGAFTGCSSLEFVYIPKGVTNVGSDAFKDCTRLKTVEFLSDESDATRGQIRIGASAFKNCEGLETVVLPERLRVIKEYTFFFCSKLRDIHIPDSVAHIERNAFEGCESIHNVVLPRAIESVGTAAFSGCTGLRTVVSLPYDNRSFIDIKLEPYVFQQCRSLESVRLPRGIVFISEGCFDQCERLKSVEILGGGDPVYGIDEGAFNNCHSLSQLPEMPSLTYVHINAFTGCEKLEVIPCSRNNELGEHSSVFDGLVYEVWACCGNSPANFCLTSFKTRKEAYKFAEDYNWEYVDENEFVWNLVIREK